MRTIRTTLLLSLPCGACVLNQPEATTDVALDTGTETTQVSAADSSSSSADSSSSDSADASSSSGEPDPGTASSSGDAPELCGNGIVDPGEECDGGLRNDDCSGHETYSGGQLGCGPDCRLDTSACCEAPIIKPCDAPGNDDPFNAIELDCDVIKDQGWDRYNAVSLKRRDLPDGYDPTSLRIFSSFGDSKYWTPRTGERALILSTGSLDPVSPTGALVMPPGAMKPGVDNKNLNFPAGLSDLANAHRITPAAGGGNGLEPLEDCADAKDCSNTLQKQWDPTAPIVDLLYIEFEMAVPAGTHGYELDLAFFTAHYPQYNNEATYNDVFMIWSQSELYVGNITYLRDSGGVLQPMSLPALIDADMLAYDGENASELSGTGFHGKDMTAGGATPWLTVAGPALPGESLTLAIAGFDAYDFLFDSAMILDNFRWSCGGCELDVDCGLRLQQ